MPFTFPPEIQTALDAFSSEEAASLQGELRIAKVLLQQAVVAGRSTEAIALLKTLASLAAAHVSNSARVGALLSAESVKRISQRFLIEIMATLETLNIPNLVDVCDELGERFSRVIEEERAAATRPTRGTRLLESTDEMPAPGLQ
jgi:hypothetical protein